MKVAEPGAQPGQPAFFSRHRTRDGYLRDMEVHSSLGSWDQNRAYFLILLDRTADQPPERGAPLASSVPAVMAALASRLGNAVPGLEELLPQLARRGRMKKMARGEVFLRAGQESTFSGISTNGLFRS